MRAIWLAGALCSGWVGIWIVLGFSTSSPRPEALPELKGPAPVKVEKRYQRDAEVLSLSDATAASAAVAAPAPAPSQDSGESSSAGESFEAAFRGANTEERDGAWARQVEAQLTTALRKLPHLDVTSMHCGSTRCAMEGTTKTPRDAMYVSRDLPRLASELGLRSGKLWRSPSDSTRTGVRAVFVRDGFNAAGGVRVRPAKLSRNDDHSAR
jgi:hypothetical protein